MRPLLFTCIMFMSICCLYSQFDDRKRSLKRYEREWKTLFEENLEYFMYGEFNIALKGFSRLLLRDRTNSNINFLIAMCMYNTRTPTAKIIPYLEIAVQRVNAYYGYTHRETSAPVFALYNLGEMYLQNYRFDEAIKVFEEFKTYLTDRARDALYLMEVETYLRYCNNAKKHFDAPIKNIKISPFMVVNSDYSEYTPFIDRAGERFYFSSDRRGSTGGSYMPDFFRTDIYYMNKGSDQRWSKLRKMGHKVNTSGSEYVGSYSEGGNTFIFSCEGRRQKEHNLYELKIDDRGKFSFPSVMSPNINTDYNETGGFVSANGRYLFFASDRPGGYGGKDIYYSEKLPNGEWGRAYNLGPSVNTLYDEDFPFLLDDNVTLYFSSKGHDSMGGYDIFVSTLTVSGTWITAENIGYPINTTSDDICFFITADEKKAYYSTLRNAHKSPILNTFDIYEIIFR